MNLSEIIRQLIPDKFDDCVHRIYNPDHGFLETIGSYKNGGRWNRKCRYGALYTSLSKQTAILEQEQMAQKRNLIVQDIGRRDHVVIHVKLNKMLNLVTTKFYGLLEISREDMLNDAGLCLQIADEARNLHFEALLVPSVTESGNNLVIYMDKLVSGWELKEKNREEDISLDNT